MISGSVGAGKSFLGCAKGVMYNMMYPGAKGLICRKEASSLKVSTIKTLLGQILPSELIVSYNQMTGELVHRTNDPEIDSYITMCGLDRSADQTYPTKIGSTEYDWIFIDEGIETSEGDWDMLATRLRYRIPNLDDEQNNKLPRQMWTATNPSHPGHYLYKFFFKSTNPDRFVVALTPYENPYLSEVYLKQLEETLTGVRRQRLLEGKWIQAEGLIYSSFNQDTQVNDKDFLNIGEYKSITMGVDHNYPIPRAALLIGFRSDGGVDILDEFYRERTHIEGLMQWVEELYEKNKRNVYIYADPSDPSAIFKLSTCKGAVVHKADNAVKGGISAVGKYFDTDKIRISPKCVNLINQINSYCWKPGYEDEEPLKKDDHLVDCLRYGIFSHDINAGQSFFFEDKGYF
jgi:PBSX family phage terminase large subunit